VVLVQWPDWWLWELEFVPHLLKRMTDRDFDEVALRSMLERAQGYRPDFIQGRFVVSTRHRLHPWEVIVEPDDEDQLLVVVTAYPKDS
jgi:Domain of unknown function (DUF4258)